MEIAALITGVIGVIAFVMAAPSFAQMYWGKPRIELEFGGTALESARFLECHITNSLVTNRLLRWLGVRRAIALDVWATLEISEGGTGRVILPETVVKFTGRTGEDPAGHVSIASATIGRTIGVVFFDPQDNKVKAWEEQNTVFASGQYLARVSVVAAERVSRESREFTVRNDGSVSWRSKVS